MAASTNMASEAVPAIAENVVELIKLLIIHNKVSTARLHLVGFGLGGHVVANIGRPFKDIARITGEYK